MDEREHLAQADQHIADAESRISKQEQRIAAMEAASEDVVEGQRLLDLFRSTLVELHVHRRMILDNIARERGGGGVATPSAD